VKIHYISGPSGMLAVYRESDEWLNAYFNSMEYQFQMDKYLLASNGGHSDGGDPLFSWEATYYMGATYQSTFRLLGMGTAMEISPLKIEMLTLHYDTKNGFSIIPYRSPYGSVSASRFPFEAGFSYNYYNNSSNWYGQFSTLRYYSNGTPRLILYDYGTSLFGFGFESYASYSAGHAFNYIINHNMDHIKRTGVMPYRGR
jgi:hypothetical protein